MLYLGVAMVLVTGVSWQILLSRRPERVDLQRPLFRGVSYQRIVRELPRPLIFHVITIDLNDPGLHFLVTAPDDKPDTNAKTEPKAIANTESTSPLDAEPRSDARSSVKNSKTYDTLARTTEQFLRETGVQVAINGSFYFPYHCESPWDYYPHAGDSVSILGESVYRGKRYSVPNRFRPVLCFFKERPPEVHNMLAPPDAYYAIACANLLMRDGKFIPKRETNDREFAPRTAVAMDKARETMWLLVVDGRQAGYSEGVTLKELSDFAVDLGADVVVNMDGGGSSTLVIDSGTGPQVLNAPFHPNVPMWQRPVGNHLGLFAAPLERVTKTCAPVSSMPFSSMKPRNDTGNRGRMSVSATCNGETLTAASIGQR